MDLNILIVDDMPAMRLILRNMLEQIGQKDVVEAEDGDMAWEMIRQSTVSPYEPFDLVIADWNMPGLSGVDLLRAVRSNGPTRELPVFIVTAEGDLPHQNEATSAGATDYVVKPFNADRLKEKILTHFPSQAHL